MFYFILFFVSFIMSIVLLSSIKNVLKSKLTKWLLIGTILIALWLMIEVLTQVIANENLGVLFQDFKFMLIIYIAPLYYLITLEYLQMPNLLKRLSILVFIIPFISVISLIFRTPFPFFDDTQLVYQDYRPIFTFAAKTGFYVHAYYSYFLIGISMLAMFVHTLSTPKLYRKQSAFILTGSILSFATNFLVISLKFGTSVVDTTSISMLVTLWFFYYGLFKLPQTIITPLAKNLIIETMEDPVIILDRADLIVDINPSALILLNACNLPGLNMAHINKNDYFGIPYQQIVNHYTSTNIINKISDDINFFNEQIFSINTDQINYYSIHKSSILDEEQMNIGTLILFHNITLPYNYVKQLEFYNFELDFSHKIINNAHEGIIITDNELNIINTNSAFEVMYTCNSKEINGINLIDFLIKKSEYANGNEIISSLNIHNVWEGEIVDKTCLDSIQYRWISIFLISDNAAKLNRYVCIITDITKTRSEEKKVHQLSNYDLISGLPNRFLLHELVSCRLSKGDIEPFMLLFIDIQGLKLVNDSLGHLSGDVLLKQFSERLKRFVQDNNEFVARYGGDEFVLVIDSSKHYELIVQKLEYITQALIKSYNLNGQEFTVSINIGISISNHDGLDTDGLIRKASAAMHKSKKLGFNRYLFYSQEIETYNKDLFTLHRSLNKAIKDNAFSLYLQPQIRTIGNHSEIYGAEALIRWISNGKTVYSPDQFIPFAESNDLIYVIGDWILHEIFSINTQLHDNDINIELSINISQKQLEDNSLFYKSKHLLSQYNQIPIHLVYEITESALSSEFKVVKETLNKLKTLKIQIALDDFGTGFSSLSYLSQLPIDYLKIDKTFIDTLKKGENQNLTNSIIMLAQTLGMKTIAEGVEIEYQSEMLNEMGCDLLQGYLYGPAMSVESFINYYQNFNNK